MSIRTAIAAGIGLAVAAAASPASAQSNVKLVLDWAIQGNHAVFSVPIEKGYYAKEGLAIQMDRGFGSGDAAAKVASGAYDVGFADINTLVPFNAQNPDKKMVAFLMIFDESLAAVIVSKDAKVGQPKELEGKTLAAPETDAGRLLFPAFARSVGIDLGKISWKTVTPQLRETMLIQKQADGITGFVSTSVLNLKSNGMGPDKITVWRYNDFGVPLYGSALITTWAYAEKNPNTIKALARGTLQGMKDTFADPKGAVASLKKFDNLMKVDLELDRLALVRDTVMLTKNVKENGISEVDMDRLDKSLAIVSEAYKVPVGKVTAKDVWTPAYLPPASERKL